MNIKLKCKKKQNGPIISETLNKQKQVQKYDWTSISDNIVEADIIKLDDCNNCILLSVHKRLNEQNLPQNKFQMYPYWTISYKNDQVKKDGIDFMTILKDTLYESNPLIKITYYKNIPSKCKKSLTDPVKKNIKTKFEIFGRIRGLYGTTTQDSLYDKQTSSHNFHYYIRLNKGAKIHDNIKNINITIKGNLLSPPWEYGFCGKDASYKKCRPSDYIINKTNTNLFNFKGRCIVFNTNNGNPHKYCSFKEG